MKSLELEIDYEDAINSILSFLSAIPEDERKNIWSGFAKPFFQSLFLNASTNLKKAVEDPNFPEINKSEPFIETSYPVRKTWEELKSLMKGEPSKASKNNTPPTQNFELSTNEEKLLNIINGNRLTTVDRDFEFEIPKEYLPAQEICGDQTPRVFKETKTPFSKIHFRGSFKTPNHLDFKGVIYIIITPLLAIQSTNEVRFPIFVGLSTEKSAHEKFNKRQEKAFWKRLIQLIEDEASPSQSLHPPRS